MAGKVVVGIDIGGQSAKIGVVDPEGRILSRSVIKTNVFGSDAAAFVDSLAAAVKADLAEAGVDAKAVEGVGVGAPNGNFFTGEIAHAPNLEWAAGDGVPIAAMLSERLGGLPVRLTNDANAAAVGEMHYGVAKGMKDYIVLTLGTGVGSGIVIGGQVVYGHDGNAGELGHTCVKHKGGRKCGCGKRGCLEAYASATGVARTARQWLLNGDRPSLLREMGEIDAEKVFEAAQAGDGMALDVFQYTGEILGRSIADFVAFSAPEAVILFGGLTRAGEYLLRPVRESFEEHVMPIWKGRVKILVSGLKESDAAILGASALAWKQ